MLTRFERLAEVPRARSYTKIALNSGASDQFGYAKACDGRTINFMVVEKSSVVKFDMHVASRVFSPDELESLDSYMMKYCKYSIVELLDDRLAVQVSSIRQSPRSTEPSMTGSMQPHSQKRYPPAKVDTQTRHRKYEESLPDGTAASSQRKLNLFKEVPMPTWASVLFDRSLMRCGCP